MVIGDVITIKKGFFEKAPFVVNFFDGLLNTTDRYMIAETTTMGGTVGVSVLRNLNNPHLLHIRDVPPAANGRIYWCFFSELEDDDYDIVDS